MRKNNTDTQKNSVEKDCPRIYCIIIIILRWTNVTSCVVYMCVCVCTAV